MDPRLANKNHYGPFPPIHYFLGKEFQIIMQHFMKKAAALALAMVMALSLATMALAADFEDMPTDWSADAVQSAVANGLLSGKDGKIAASDNLTRAEMATIITRAFGAEVKDNISFTDVASDAWYNGYVAQVVHMGVMSGKGGNTFAPAANITRQEVFTVLARALKLADGSAEDLAAFSDADKVASWAVPTVSALVKAGYVSGSNGALNPTANITRAEFAQVMYNIFNNAYLNQAATYEEVDGKNVIISSANVTVKGVEIEGDVVIADGVGDGDVFLEDVTVGGRVVVRGGGMNSVHFRGSKAGSVIVTKVDGNVRVVFDEESTVETVSVEGGKASTDVRIEGAVKNVVVNDATSTVVLADAKVEKLDVAAANAKISLAGATTVAEMTVAEGATNTTMAAETTAEVTKLTTAEDVFIDNEDVIKESNDEEKINPERPAESGDPAESTAPSGDGAIEPDDPNKPLGEKPVSTPAPIEAPDPIATNPVPTDPVPSPSVAAGDDEPCASHSWDGTDTTNYEKVEVAPTCEENGTVTLTCKTCGSTQVTYTQKVAHVASDTPARTVNATCSSNGYKSFSCKWCGLENVTVTPIDKSTVAHTDGGYVITATEHYRQCAKCGTKINVAGNGTVTGDGAAAAHSYGDPVSTGTANHKQECSVCHYVQTSPHEGTAAWVNNDPAGHFHKCTTANCNYKSVVTKHTFEDGVCSVCEYPCGHEYSDKTSANPSGNCSICGKACEHPGTDAGAKCATCGKIKPAETTPPHTGTKTAYEKGTEAPNAASHRLICTCSDGKDCTTNTPGEWTACTYTVEKTIGGKVYTDGACVCGRENPSPAHEKHVGTKTAYEKGTESPNDASHRLICTCSDGKDCTTNTPGEWTACTYTVEKTIGGKVYTDGACVCGRENPSPANEKAS